MEYDIGAVVFGNFTIVEKIGEGGFGTVYRVEKNDIDSEDGGTVSWFKHNSSGTVSALKVIKIPQSDSEYKYILSELEDEASVSTHFEECVEKIKKEIDNMLMFQNNKHIVSYQNHEIIKYPDKIAWDILIKMELLTPLSDYMNGNLLGNDLRPVDEKKIIRFGCDLCEALSVCHKKNILHRDLKPGNIFVDSDGNYKLGDFGVSRTIEGTKSGMSKAGTDAYMAPEVYNGNRYGFKSDIYSLGIVMYYLCNKKRLPFYPPYPKAIHLSDRDTAMQKRMRGDVMPLPSDVSGDLARVILKACAFNPDDRYQTAEEFKNALEYLRTDPAVKKAAEDFVKAFENSSTGSAKKNVDKASTSRVVGNDLGNTSTSNKTSKMDLNQKYYSMWKEWLIDLYGDSGGSKVRNLFRPYTPPFVDVGPKIDREIFGLAKKYIAAGENISSGDVLALVITKSGPGSSINGYRFDINYEPVFGRHGIIICTDKIYISTYKIVDNYDIVNYSIKYSEIKSLSVEQSPNKRYSFLVISLYSGNEIRAFFHPSWKANKFVEYLKQFLSIIK